MFSLSLEKYIVFSIFQKRGKKTRESCKESLGLLFEYT